MNSKILAAVIVLFTLTACHSNKQDLDHESHDEPKFQYTAYSNDFELFAEADPFILGETANILSHFSHLPDFQAMTSGKMCLQLIVGVKEVSQTLENPTRKGIYSFDITPSTSGKGKLQFTITTDKGEFLVVVPDIIVYETHEEAHEAAESVEFSGTNAVSFTKEQSWKIDFSTQLVQKRSFGTIIKSTAFIQSAQGDELIICAKSNGIVSFLSENIVPGKSLSKGQAMLSVSGNGLIDNNLQVRFTEAQNNFEKAKADYQRMKELSKDKIISEKEMLNAKNLYDNAKVVFDNLNRNFDGNGQKVSCPADAHIRQLLVKQGQYVETGQALLIISQNKRLTLTVEVQQKYASDIENIHSANIISPRNGKTYSLESLKGKILSIGRNTDPDNYLLPVILQIENNDEFINGGFCEVYLKTTTNTQALVVPNTALMEEQGHYYVFVQIHPELFEKREVKTGTTDGKDTEILSGIKELDRVITNGAIQVKLSQASGALDPHAGHVH